MSPPAPIIVLLLLVSTSAFLLAPPSSAAASARAFHSTALGLFAPPATKAADGSFLDNSYVCKDCGYIVPTAAAFDKLASNWSCPPCGSAKNRFKAVPGGKGKAAAAPPKKKGWF